MHYSSGQEKDLDMKRLIAAFGAIDLALLTAACTEGETTTVETAAPSMASSEANSTTSSIEESSAAIPSESSAHAAASGDIVDTAVNAGSFNTLVSAVQAAGLEDTPHGEGTFTAFAPTDDAFAALPSGALDTLPTDPEGDLADILKYHVVTVGIPRR